MSQGRAIGLSLGLSACVPRGPTIGANPELLMSVLRGPVIAASIDLLMSVAGGGATIGASVGALMFFGTEHSGAAWVC